MIACVPFVTATEAAIEGAGALVDAGVLGGACLGGITGDGCLAGT